MKYCKNELCLWRTIVVNILVCAVSYLLLWCEYLGLCCELFVIAVNIFVCAVSCRCCDSCGPPYITYKDIRPSKDKDAMEKVRKLDLNERLKAIKYSSITDAEAIELIEITSKGTTVIKVAEQGRSFIEAGEIDKLLPLR